VPHPSWLRNRVGAIELEVAPTTAGAAAAPYTDDPVVLDLEIACGCACARDRAAAARLDPPRSLSPVVVPVRVDLSDGRLLPAGRLIDVDLPAAAGDVPDDRAIDERIRALRATFVERGLSHVDVLRPPEPLTSERFSASFEPWADGMDRPASLGDVESVLNPVPDADTSRRTATPGHTLTPPFAGRVPAPR
jgi:hypothetical protein